MLNYIKKLINKPTKRDMKAIHRYCEIEYGQNARLAEDLILQGYDHKQIVKFL